MTFILHEHPPQANCPQCGHIKIQHSPDGLGFSCAICLFLEREKQPLPGGKVCTMKFKFKLSQSEVEQAKKADKESFPPRTICAICNFTWQQHMGFLCPTGDDTFLPLLESFYG